MIFFFSLQGQSQLLEFHHYVNSINPNIRTTIQYSRTEIPFLDLLISVDDNGDLHTSIYRKDTDRNTLLRADSFHSPHLINNIPYGQFLRLRRICDQDQDFNSQSTVMSDRFRERGYRKEVVKNAYKKAMQCKRENLFTKKQRPQRGNQIFFSTRFSKLAVKIKTIIRKNWGILQSDPSLRGVFTDQPSFCFRRAPSLRDRLVRSHLTASVKKLYSPVFPKPQGNYRCGRCNHCENVVKTNTFVDVF